MYVLPSMAITRTSCPALERLEDLQGTWDVRRGVRSTMLAVLVFLDVYLTYRCNGAAANKLKWRDFFFFSEIMIARYNIRVEMAAAAGPGRAGAALSYSGDFFKTSYDVNKESILNLLYDEYFAP